MKRVCFIEMEGVLKSHNNYSAEEKKVSEFVKKLSTFCKTKKIDLYLLSGYHEVVAKQEFKESGLVKYFDKKHFLFVDDAYISQKADPDEKIHRDSLDKDPEFVDSYFKQVVINKFKDEKSFEQKDVLLLCNDIWVDGYYTTRFSKVDFALFEENILERGVSAERISGLAYFSLDFNSVKILLTSFPEVNFKNLDKFVFETMKKVIMGSVDLSGVVKKIVNKQSDNVGGLNETKID